MTQRRSRSKSAVDRRLTEEALLKEPRVEEAIGKLVRWGVKRDQVLRLVLSIPGASKEAVPLVEGMELRRLRELPDRIKGLSGTIKRVNDSPFLTPERLRELATPHGYPKPLIGTATPEQAETTSTCFLAIPNLLQLYAEHLREWLDHFYPTERGRRGISRDYFRMQRLLTLRLLTVVRDATMKPRYSEVATLLDAAYRVGGGPAGIDAEGLRKLEQHAPLELRMIVRFLP
jgi:hypothetical protein